VDGQLNLINVPQIGMRYDDTWQANDANTPDATLSVDSDKGLTISNKHRITLKGPLNTGDVTVSGTLDAGGHTIEAGKVNTIGITAGEYKLSGPSPQSHDYGYVVPKGGIIMWSGDSGNIPQGWVLCDGHCYNQDGTRVDDSQCRANPDPTKTPTRTPDLTGRFVVGAGPTGTPYLPYAQGGNNLIKLDQTQLPSHSHGTDVTVDPPSHGHKYYVVPPGGKAGGPISWNSSATYGFDQWTSDPVTIGVTVNVHPKVKISISAHSITRCVSS
jgi:hypothetical protein